MNGEQSLTRIEPMPVVMPEPTTPAALMRRATDVAGICREIVLKTACEIQGRKFVKVEGWESIATAHGCFAGAEDADRVYDNQGNHIGYKAKGVLRNAHGEIIATGEGFVGFDEKDRKGNPTWKNRAEYAGKAMAQTRAISRTCRGVFAHVVVLIDAGLSTTPAEEVPDGGFDDNARAARAKPANVPQGKSESKPKEAPPQATEKTRNWFLAEMRKSFSDQTLLQWGCDDGPPYALRPDEGLEDWPLHLVPTSQVALKEKIERCAQFMGVSPQERSKTAQDASQAPSTPPKPENASQGQAAPKKTVYGGAAEDQAWFNAILTVPRKGQKRDQYLQSPDRIGDLYNARHDDEDARRRLFGFLHNWQPEGWTKRSGEKMPPSDADLKCREMLDLFGEWFAENHADECGND